MRTTRRIAGSAITILAVTALAGCGNSSGGSTNVATAKATDKLNIYAWTGEVPDSVVKAFETQTGIKVTVDTFDSNETMTAKLAAGAGGYDIVEPSQYAVQQLIGQKLIQPLDQSQIHGLDNLGQKFRNATYDPANKYSVPWVWGTTGLAYNDTCANPAPTSWKSLWDPKYKGKMYMLDNMLAAYIAGLQVNGYSAASTKETQIAAATKSLEEQKPLLAGYNATNYPALLDSGQACIAEAWGGSEMAKVVASNPHVHYIIPSEGGTLWTDSFSIANGAPNLVNAYKWLSFTLQPKIAAMASNQGGVATPNAAALPMIKPDIKKNPAIYQPAKAIAKADFILDPGTAMQYFQQGWTKVKAS